MKLKLEVVRDISVLVAEGPITPENFAILRAGIKKLFKDGKNKIILELPDSGTFTPPILREFATLNLMASELSGSIVLAQIAPLTRAKIEAFSKPPAVRCFTDRTIASEFFYPKDADPIPYSPAPAAIPVSAPPLSPTVANPIASPAPVAATLKVANPTPPKAYVLDPAPPTEAVSEEKAKQFKAEARSKELGDLGTVRKKLSELEAENAELKSQIAELVVTRRDPPDLESWKEKVMSLEKQLADAIKTAQEATAGKK